MRNIFLPWRWKRTVKAGLDARVGYVLTALNDVRTQVGHNWASRLPSSPNYVKNYTAYAIPSRDNWMMRPGTS